MLPAVDAPTGSDTKSRISTKTKAFKIAQSDIFRENLATFGEDELTGDLLRVAECFLVRCFATVDVATSMSYAISSITIQRKRLIWIPFTVPLLL